MQTPPRLMLVDGHALFFRAYHAVRSLTTSRGELVNATFGFTSMLLTALQLTRPEYVAVAFDLPEPTFRHLQFEAYKAQRPPMPAELASQFPRVRQVVEALNIPIFEAAGFEADDVIGTLSRLATEGGIDTTIVTGDLDSLQLVDDHVTVLINRQGVQDTALYDPAAVEKRFGFAPPRLPDYKALVGDSSDNIPKVPGVGEKTASDWIKTYGDLDGVIAHIADLKPRLADALREHIDQVRQSKVLATIRRDVPMTLEIEKCAVHDYDRETALALFQELEFRSLVNKLPAPPEHTASAHKPTAFAGGHLSQGALFPNEAASGGAEGTTAEAPQGNYQLVTTADDLRKLADRLNTAKMIAFDVETTAPDAIRSELVGISVAITIGEAFYIPVGHHPAFDAEGPLEQLLIADVVHALRPAFENADIPKYGHNAKFDINVLARYGLPVKGLAFDTMIAAFLLSHRVLGLKDLAANELGIRMTQITDLIGVGAKQRSMADVPMEAVAPYACADVDITLRLKEHFEPRLAAQHLTDLNSNIETPMVAVLAAMELTGITIDGERLQQMSKELGAQLLRLEQEVFELAGHSFNLNSTQQLSKVLFEELKLPPGGRTQSGFSTGSEVLDGLRERHPIIGKILEFRELIKLKSTYVDGLPALINPATGRVHTSFNQTVAATGRLSSSGPNLQNIPIRTPNGKVIRKAFVPGKPGWLLVAADYSQVELRVLAHLSKDPALVEAFRRGEDIHTATAARVFGVEQSAVTSNQRRVAKVINFGILYGMGEQAVARQGEITRQEAATFIAQYFDTFPGVREFIERTKREAREWGYVSTVSGRRRQMTEIQSPMREIRAQAERAAVNAPVQGSAADIIKIAMVRLHREFCHQHAPTKMLLQVHDELVFETPAEEVSQLVPLVRSVMEGAMTLEVPLKVDVAVGPNWAEMEELAI